MKAHPKKFIQINFEYISSQDLLKLFDHIRKEINSGERDVRSYFRGHEFSFKVKNELLLKSTPRVEAINGVDCLVYQSQINFNHEK